MKILKKFFVAGLAVILAKNVYTPVLVNHNEECIPQTNPICHSRNMQG